MDNIMIAGQFGEPRQLDQIDPLSKLVTVTIGGNDAGFAAVLTRCFNPVLTCQAYYMQKDSNNLDNIIDSLRPKLAAAYSAIKNKVPGAQVVALTYPQIFNTDKTCLGQFNLDLNDLNWLFAETNHLDDVIVAAARDAGITTLDVRAAFIGHQVCDAFPFVIPGLGTGLPFTDYKAWFHPTVAGQAELASLMDQYLQTPTAGW